MNPRHAAALALVGWYLMVPPVVAARVTDRYGGLRLKGKSRITHTEEKLMKAVTSFTLNLAAALLIVLASAGIAAAGNDTCAGVDALFDDFCVTLTNSSSGNHANSAFGAFALLDNTTGSSNTAAGASALASNTTGGENTATGVEALLDNTTGEDNTAAGASALFGNTTGGGNTAAGAFALFGNTTGNSNTAAGAFALDSNTTGEDNTAAGASALFGNTTGSDNTAAGASALASNTTGGENTATGVEALLSNTTGGGNTAAGTFTLDSNTTGSNNTAAGAAALASNTTGSSNTAAGAFALAGNTTGGDNTAAGTGALKSNTTGGSNIGIGANAGANLTTGDNNIDIGNAGVAAEAGTIRIGTQGTQTGTFIAGIFGTPKIKKACQVVVEPTGLVGCVKSSARYKRDIRDMGNASDKLMKLRPVTFRYKADSTGTEQYGLIAEEVEKVYPELVIDGADGKAETVAYQVLPAMLLNEVQKQAMDKDAQIAALRRQVASQEKQIDALKKKDAQIDALAERMNALERQARLARPEHLASAMR
jgi:hypothetical protein